jgi:hypothetical protein
MLIGCNLGHRGTILRKNILCFCNLFQWGILYWDPGFIVRGKEKNIEQVK